MKKIYLVDGNSFIYRMFFALPEFSTKSWVIVNAVFGIAKFFCNQLKNEKPDYLIFIKDARWENFRHKLYSEYKATRDKIPDNLKSQITLIEEMISKMNLKIIEIPWYEADDVIATLAKKYLNDEQNEIFILSWDKDLYSLVTKNIKIYDISKQKIYDEYATQKKFGIPSKYITDYLAIVWDSSDNIPWISWFWPKKAIELINKYNTIENIYDHINDDDFVIWWKNLQKLKEQKEIAFLSKKLATLYTNVELDDFNLNDFSFDFNKIYNDDLKKFFYEYEFFSLLPKEIKTYRRDITTINLNVKIIDNDSELYNLLEKIKKYREIILDTETTSVHRVEASLVWISIFLDEKNIYYINFWHKNSKKRVSQNALNKFLNNLFLFDNLTIVWHNIKYDLEVIKIFLKKDFVGTKSQYLKSWQLSLL